MLRTREPNVTAVSSACTFAYASVTVGR
jgi:hypothetical protein